MNANVKAQNVTEIVSYDVELYKTLLLMKKRVLCRRYTEKRRRVEALLEKQKIKEELGYYADDFYEEI